MNSFFKALVVVFMIRNFFTSTTIYYELNFVKELTFQTDVGEIFVSENNGADDEITVTPYIVRHVKEQFFYPMNGISKSYPEDDSVNDNVTKFDKNLGVSKDYNKNEYKIGDGVR